MILFAWNHSRTIHVCLIHLCLTHYVMCVDGFTNIHFPRNIHWCIFNVEYIKETCDRMEWQSRSHKKYNLGVSVVEEFSRPRHICWYEHSTVCIKYSTKTWPLSAIVFVNTMLLFAIPQSTSRHVIIKKSMGIETSLSIHLEWDNLRY